VDRNYDVAKTCDAYLITGNTKDYPAAPFIVTPAQFLAMMDDKLSAANRVGGQQPARKVHFFSRLSITGICWREYKNG
jgi:hypothetical protein